MTLRIVTIRTRYPHWGQYSGIGRLLHYIDDTDLELLDHRAFDGDDDFPLESRTVRALLRRLVRRRGMAWYALSDLRAEIRALRAVLTRSYGIVHYLDAEHSAQYLPLLISRLPGLGARTIATFHQPPDRLEAIVRQDVIRRIDHVVLMSPEQRPLFQGVLPASRISVLPHGVDTEFFRRPPLGDDVRPDGETFECLCVGHYLRDFSAVAAVSERLSHVPGLRIRVVSSQPTGLAGLTNVRVESGLSDEALLAAYRAADVLFMPLRSCTANNALLEAMACGLPIVSTDLQSVRFYAPDEGAALVRANDPDRFASELLTLRDHPDRRARMSRAVRKRAEELSWRRIAPLYEELYRSVAAGVATTRSPT